MPNLDTSHTCYADVTKAANSLFQSLPGGLSKIKNAQNNFTRHIMGALAASTLNTKYLPAWNKFKLWLSSYNVHDLSLVDENIVAAYLSHLFTQAEANSTGDSSIQLATAAISFHFKSMGSVAPVSSAYIDLLKNSAKRNLRPQRSNCEPICAEDLHKLLVTHLTPTCSLKTRMHLTTLLIMYLGLLRFNDVQHILVHRELLRFIKSDDGSKIEGVLIWLPTSKTDTQGVGAWVAIGATGGLFCPVKLLSNLLSLGGYRTHSLTHDVGPLLRGTITKYYPRRMVLAQVEAPFSSPIKALSYSSFRSSILSLCKNVLPKHIGLHSARSGGASAAAEYGIDSRLACGLGRWKQGTTYSDTYVKMTLGNTKKYFDISRALWPY